MKSFTIIVAAASSNMGIGRLGELPWRLPGDMALFKKLTTVSRYADKKNVVIMGRKTWQSIPKKFRPLPQRVNVVLSKNPMVREELEIPSDVIVASSLDEAMDTLSRPEMASVVDQIFVIGGETIYREAITSPRCSRIRLTSVEVDIADCDTFFPVISASEYRMISRSAPMNEGGIAYRFTELERIQEDSQFDQDPVGKVSANEEEMQYIRLIERIIKKGAIRGDRTGTGTVSQFGAQMRFSLRDNIFPLLTTKKVFWRGVAEELLWFVKGCTNGKELSDKGVKIWDGNGSREFLDQRGLSHREVGDLGPVYGFQWRHFGADYEDFNTDYTGKGVDQLVQCIEKIKSCPEDRRIVLTAWNPADLDKMALPPCHMFCQFYVANGELSCQMYQRSADMGLGVPFNIASYSLLTRMVAQVCGLKAGEFIHTIGDAHVYSNHVDALQEQLVREPRPFPKLHINLDVTDIDGFNYSDFTIEGYDPLPAIKMKMAV